MRRKRRTRPATGCAPRRAHRRRGGPAEEDHQCPGGTGRSLWLGISGTDRSFPRQNGKVLEAGPNDATSKTKKTSDLLEGPVL